MSKANLIKETEALIEEINNTHRYSMSRIYGLYNRVFEKKETPQSCASCLMRKARELKSWLEKNKDLQDTENIKEINESELTEEKPKKERRKKEV